MISVRPSVLACMIAVALTHAHSSAQAGEQLADRGPNAVALWSERGAATILERPTGEGTPQERRPNVFLDMATMHLAIHSAILASPAPSREAAAAAAAYAVLKSLFPHRSKHYQGAYDTEIAAMSDGPDKDRGLQIGAEQAARVLTMRADDGRLTKVVPVAPGTAAGAYRGVKPINQTMPHVKPFALQSVSQFPTPAAPSLDSAVWAKELAETAERGGEGRAVSEKEIEIARFHTEPPPRFWTRNLARFARSQATLAENARLMALLWVTQADTLLACFDAKYRHYRWRPETAIVFQQAGWKPRLPTPRHPEYPAAHSCGSAALAQNIESFFGTRQVAFSFDSTVTGTTHEWSSADEMVDEVRDARIVGGMHFRSATVAGERLGVQVARWVASRLPELADPVR